MSGHCFYMLTQRAPLSVRKTPSSCWCNVSTFGLEQEVGDRFLTGLGHSLSDKASWGHVLLLTDCSKWGENQTLYPEGYSPYASSAWKPSPCLGQGCICSARPFPSSELLAFHVSSSHARTRVPSAAPGSVNLGFLLILIFILGYRISYRAHNSSHSAARIHTAVAACSWGAVLSRGCTSQDGKLGFLAGLSCHAPWHHLTLVETEHAALPSFLLPVCVSMVVKGKSLGDVKQNHLTYCLMNVIHNFTPEIYNPFLCIKSFLSWIYIYSIALLCMETLGVISSEINKPSDESWMMPLFSGCLQMSSCCAPVPGSKMAWIFVFQFWKLWRREWRCRYRKGRRAGDTSKRCVHIQAWVLWTSSRQQDTPPVSFARQVFSLGSCPGMQKDGKRGCYGAQMGTKSRTWTPARAWQIFTVKSLLSIAMVLKAA